MSSPKRSKKKRKNAPVQSGSPAPARKSPSWATLVVVGAALIFCLLLDGFFGRSLGGGSSAGQSPSAGAVSSQSVAAP